MSHRFNSILSTGCFFQKPGEIYSKSLLTKICIRGIKYDGIWVLGFSLEGSEILLHSGLTNLLVLAASLNKAGPLWQHTCLFSSHSTHTSRAWHSCQGVCRKISPYNYSPQSLAFSILSCFYLYMMRLLKFGDFKVQSKTRPIKNPFFSDTSRCIKN